MGDLAIGSIVVAMCVPSIIVNRNICRGVKFQANRERKKSEQWQKWSCCTLDNLTESTICLLSFKMSRPNFWGTNLVSGCRYSVEPKSIKKGRKTRMVFGN